MSRTTPLVNERKNYVQLKKSSLLAGPHDMSFLIKKFQIFQAEKWADLMNTSQNLK